MLKKSEKTLIFLKSIIANVVRRDKSGLYLQETAKFAFNHLRRNLK